MASKEESVLKQFRGKTSITSAEFEQIFKEYDKDGNGYIEAGELDSFLGDLFKLKEHPEDMSYEEFKAWLMREGDTVNKDGKIEKAELAHILPTRENFLLTFREKVPISIEDLLKIWQDYDSDRSGYLEKTELQLFCRDLLADKPSLTKADVDQEIEKIMTEFDIDQDGRLNIQEMAELLRVNEKENLLRTLLNGRKTIEGSFDNLFATFDTDGDGQISKTELIQLLRDSLGLLNKSADESLIESLADAVIAAYDVNNDQKLSKAELELYFVDKHAG